MGEVSNMTDVTNGIGSGAAATSSTSSDLEDGLGTVIGDKSRAKAQLLAKDVVLTARVSSGLTILVKQGPTEVQYHHVIGPRNRRRWVRITDSDRDPLKPTRRQYGSAAVEHDDGELVTITAVSEQFLKRELYDALAATGHPLRDQHPMDDPLQDSLAEVTVLPREEAPEPPVSPHRAFQQRPGPQRP